MEINLLGFIHRHLAISHLVLILYKHRCGDTHSYWSCVWEGCGGGGSASVGSATEPTVFTQQSTRSVALQHSLYQMFFGCCWCQNLDIFLPFYQLE